MKNLYPAANIPLAILEIDEDSLQGGIVCDTIKAAASRLLASTMRKVQGSFL